MPRGAKKQWTHSKSKAQTPSSVQVYYDISGGMHGYAAGSCVFGNLATITSNFSKSSPFPAGELGVVEFSTFGEYAFDAGSPEAPALIANRSALAAPGTYDDQETKIADLLGWIAHSIKTSEGGNKPLSLMVTDLMLDNDTAVDEFAASVGGRLRTLMIEQGLAIGFLGARVFADDSVNHAAAQDRKQPADDFHLRPIDR